MKGNTDKETHFRLVQLHRIQPISQYSNSNISIANIVYRVTIVSEEFQGKNLMQRHRSIYNLLNEELQAGLHALSLKTKTPQEIEKSS